MQVMTLMLFVCGALAVPGSAEKAPSKASAKVSEQAPAKGQVPLESVLGVGFGMTSGQVIDAVPGAVRRRSGDVSAMALTLADKPAGAIFRFHDNVLYRVEVVFLERGEGMMERNRANYPIVDAWLIKQLGEGTGSCNEAKTACSREWTNGVHKLEHKLVYNGHVMEVYDIKMWEERLEQGRQLMKGRFP